MLQVQRLYHYNTVDNIVQLLLTSDIPFQITKLVHILGKTTYDRSEIKSAYAMPFELQGKKIRQYILLFIGLRCVVDAFKGYTFEKRNPLVYSSLFVFAPILCGSFVFCSNLVE